MCPLNSANIRAYHRPHKAYRRNPVTRRTKALPTGQVRPVEASKPESTISPLREVKKWALQKALDALLLGGVALTGWNFWGKAFDWVSRKAAPFEGWLPQPHSGERDPFFDP
ncbi:hypothetical protein AA0113_g3162 [Alternaria arborescens]|uniref:Uncharacterized protein n=1 Tax=Alternaria arborescens TaxID=156630 RepID=A0A4Q4SIH6_9PLEO|nr:hypothetical protein AA0111_g2235 [Alternaria arborescens]RYN27949.1 hypothetical protein AA0112_g7706 [Alternaria arborescens]RYO37894.1 hypothetical protein AA0111_g2235 [Alternaria arborescens]RYO70460.1 hypothetical protein AA0113_g3162 [Alternaria arborescens]